MPECLFCKIIKKDVPSDILYEDKQVVIFRDIQPKAPTHLLIIPKDHTESVLTLSSDEAGLPGMLIMKAKEFAYAKEIPGYKLTFHVGREGGQIIDHLHLHLMAEKKI